MPRSIESDAPQASGSSFPPADIHHIQDILGYTFQNPRLLEQAFTRSSYSAENMGCPDNEVLEFIGDSILGMVAVKGLISRYKWGDPPLTPAPYFQCELDEDELSRHKIRLVQRASLATATHRAGLETYLRMGKGDILAGVQTQASVMEDLFEAIIGAVALDSNWDMSVLEGLIHRLLDMDRLLENGFDGEPDPVAELSEWFWQQGGKPAFEPALPVCSSLPYACSVDLGRSMLNHTAYGYGKTPDGARRMAASRAMTFINSAQSLAHTVINAVGAPDPQRAVNQLQELWQKGLIPQPKYDFVQEGMTASGNPQWRCICTVEGLVEDCGGYVCETKKEAKQIQAFDTLCRLLGTDLTSLFIAYGQPVDF